MTDALATTPEPPYIAVIFSSVRNEGDDGYTAMSAAMEQLAARQPGYLGIESARDELGITVSYWATEADATAWKRVAAHEVAQRRGREEWYRDYRVRVATVTRSYSHPDPRPAHTGDATDPGGETGTGGETVTGDAADQLHSSDASEVVTVHPWTGPWPDGDPDANFKSDVALYSRLDPLTTVRNLSNALDIPVGGLVRYVLAKWASGGSAALMELGPAAVYRLWEPIERAEQAATDEARLAAYDELRQYVSWLKVPLDDPDVY
jgi:heme-degrading monooxygenase HmoA